MKGESISNAGEIIPGPLTRPVNIATVLFEDPTEENFHGFDSEELNEQDNNS